VQGVNQLAREWIPDQIVMDSAETIISIDDLRFDELGVFFA
jgi:hypothetical protein